MLSLIAVQADSLVQADSFPLNDDTVSPGFLGFGVFLALGAATFLLIRSMNKQIKKIQAPSEAELIQQEWERAEREKAAKTAPEGGGSAPASGKASPGDG